MTLVKCQSWGCILDFGSHLSIFGAVNKPESRPVKVKKKCLNNSCIVLKLIVKSPVKLFFVPQLSQNDPLSRRSKFGLKFKLTTLSRVKNWTGILFSGVRHQSLELKIQLKVCRICLKTIPKQFVNNSNASLNSRKMVFVPLMTKTRVSSFAKKVVFGYIFEI